MCFTVVNVLWVAICVSDAPKRKFVAETGVVPLPVLENAADATKNAGIGLGEYISLCTSQVPCDLLVVKNGPQLLLQ